MSRLCVGAGIAGRGLCPLQDWLFTECGRGGAYLLESGAVSSAGEAISLLRSVRPSIVIRPEAVAALNRFEIGWRHRSCTMGEGVVGLCS